MAVVATRVALQLEQLNKMLATAEQIKIFVLVRNRKQNRSWWHHKFSTSEIIEMQKQQGIATRITLQPEPMSNMLATAEDINIFFLARNSKQNCVYGNIRLACLKSSKYKSARNRKWKHTPIRADQSSGWNLFWRDFIYITYSVFGMVLS